jgi:thiol:disulfide interchange protein DsbD
MKRLLFLLSIVFFSTTIDAQIYDPVKWSTSVEKVSDSEYDLVIQAMIDTGWHLYSQNVPDDGPIPTTFIFESTPDFELVGSTSEEEGHTVDDPVFQMEIKYFENKATFKQRIKVLSENKFKILGEVEFMVCDDAQCLPPTYVDLDFSVGGNAIAATNISKKKADEFNQIEVNPENSRKKKKSNWAIFLGTLLAGILVTFTPCVFPMIPLTVSFFLKQNSSKSRGKFNAVFYGICIILIHLLISVPFHIFETLNPSIFNEISTNVYLNVFFFAIFVVFAISFFGAFEITIPNRFASKSDEASKSGGLIGIFFMALTLIIVSFSCTGPALGLVLGSVLSSDGGAMLLSVAMFGFGMGLALPFVMFALFPNMLSTMPKSGGWLNTVKVVFGFIELALAFKFLSNADLVLQLHWLEREVFLAIWIAIFGTLAFYLFGKIQLPHDSPNTHISVGRLSLGLLTLSFTIYMIPGLWGAPLNLISAFPPPQHYSESPYGVGFSKLGGGSTMNKAHSDIPEGAHLMAPHDILAFNDYDLGLAYAKKIGKPVMLDFTGHACVNCRKMEQHVWAKDKILPILKNDVVLISLYVDDKRKLPKGEEFNSKLRPGKKLKYIGQRWSEFQTIKYKANAQPFYVLMGHDEENLIDPVAYTPDVDTYYNWLKKGIANFKN